MNWKIKSKLFQILTSVPFGAQIHYLLQRYLTKEWPRKEENLNLLLIAAKKIYKDINENAKFDIASSSFIEIGCGRDLAVAIALRMMGVGHITCVDITRQAKISLINHAAKYMAKNLEQICPSLNKWEELDKIGIS